MTGVFLLLGGIGLFLYGINFMSRSLEDAAGDNLRVILGKTTSNSVLAVLVGLFVTALIQSSGATSVMCAGFVDSGIMELSSALFAMLGANIGTTVTAQIVAFKITTIAPLILFIGMVLYLFVKNRFVKKIGAIILGFGLLFVGIYIMSEAVAAMPQLTELVKAFLERFNNPILCLLFGMVFTALIQSSSTSIGILQVIVASSIGNAAGLDAFVFIILGMNIGACSPVVIVSFSGNRKCKQAALSNVLSKLLGVAVFSVIWLLLPGLHTWIEQLSPDDVARQIANFHLFFNLVSTVLVFPFVKPITKLVQRLLPESPEEENSRQRLLYINPKLVVSPAVSIDQAKLEIVRMAQIAEKNLRLSVEAFFERNREKAEKVLETENLINYLNHHITGFLVQLHAQTLSDRDIERAGMMLRVVADVERIGDHAENIAEYAMIVCDNNLNISGVAMDELRLISEKAVGVLHMAVAIYSGEQFDQLHEVSRLEEEVDDLQERYIENHIGRLKSRVCEPRAGVVFSDMVTDLERCSDHAINIAYAINGEKSVVQVKKAYVITRDMSNG